MTWTRRCVEIGIIAVLLHLCCGSSLNPIRWKRHTCRRNEFECDSGSCIVVYHLCDGVVHCDDKSDETTEVCGTRRCPSQAFQCDYGACIDKELLCDGKQQCADGSDEQHRRCVGRPPPPAAAAAAGPEAAVGSAAAAGSAAAGGLVPLPAVQATTATNLQPNTSNAKQTLCPPLASPSWDVVCKLNVSEVNCENPVVPGTTAEVTCSHYYTNKEFSRAVLECLPSGSWSKDVLPCTPKCGEPNPDGLPFIAGGVEAKTGEFPWHAGIYKFNDGHWQQICGGTIVSDRVVVSAGHCFWNDGLSQKFDVKLYKIAVGKHYRDWDKRGRFTQTPEIHKIIIHNRFRGSIRHWQNDIALVVVKDAFVMSLAVSPVCLDYSENYEKLFVPGKNGIVAGWGVTETMKPSDVLKSATLPFVSFEDCEKVVPQTFLSFLTNDKFCAGHQNGTSVCGGDGGGGYIVQFRDGKWYLMGVASVGVPALTSDVCNIYQFATFTKVFDFYDFIRSYEILN